MRRLSLLTLVVALLAAGLPGTAQAASPKMWHVKITNLTSGQPMSPPLWAVHDNKLDVWSVGQLASSGMLPIVEDAFNAPLQSYLSSNRHVREAKTETGSPAGPILPGGTREFDVTSRGGDRYLSIAWMLVRTNDGFTGLDSYKLDRGKNKGKRKGKTNTKTKTLMLGAYDGGTENNNQSCAFIPGPPCGKFFVRDPTAEAIAPHPGITGGDIAAFAWTNPVAKVEITRTR
jgi:hypothetical protein